jgi:hypothetical protein
MDKWLQFFDELNAAEMNWLLLDQAPSFDEVSKAYRKYCLEDAQEIDLLVDEVDQIEDIYPKLAETNCEYGNSRKMGDDSEEQKP